MCTLCDSTNINTIIGFVPNCLQHVSGDGFNGGSDSYRQFRDTCGKRRNINLILDATTQKELTWGCVWRTRWQLLKPRQSLRITLNTYIYTYTHIYIYQCANFWIYNKQHILHGMYIIKISILELVGTLLDRHTVQKFIHAHNLVIKLKQSVQFLALLYLILSKMANKYSYCLK